MKKTAKSRHRRRRTRKHRGGGPPINPANIQWPPNYGCNDEEKEITLNVGDYIDRFGPPTGFFASPVIKQSYSYSERALPWLGIKNEKKIKYNGSQRSIRKEYYYMNYDNPLINIEKDQYHIYRIEAPINNVKSCMAAPYFNYPGGAVQYRLEKSIQEYINEGKLKEDVNFPIIPPFD